MTSERRWDILMAMNKTPFSKKCEILGQIHLFYSDTDEEGWADLFAYADVGFPLAYMEWAGLAKATDDGMNYVEEAWRLTCNTINVDVDGEYDSLVALFDASPNPPVDEEED